MIGKNVYIDSTAIIIGDVEIGDGVSIWPYAVLRGDEAPIVVGEGSNVQEHVMLHVGEGFPTTIGRDVTVGHGAVINGASIGDRCIIGMNSTIVEGARLGDGCIIGANAVITGDMVVPWGSLVVGVPGRIVRGGDPAMGQRALKNAETYHRLRDEHLTGKYKRRMGP